MTNRGKKLWDILNKYGFSEWRKTRKCLFSDLTALISEHYVAKEEVDKMVSERLRDMAMGILRARDAFVRDDFDEVWHCLYKIASPNFDKIEPWDELEKIAGYIKP